MTSIKVLNRVLDYCYDNSNDCEHPGEDDPAVMRIIQFVEKLLFAEGARDACQVCKGEKGGVPGNENIVDGIVMCDYCFAEKYRKEN